MVCQVHGLVYTAMSGIGFVYEELILTYMTHSVMSIHSLASLVSEIPHTPREHQSLVPNSSYELDT